MNSTKRIAVTGGTGHLGTGIILKLVELGYQVVSLYRSTTPSLTHESLKWIQGDIGDFNSLKDLFTDCYTVIHCAGLISIGDKSLADLIKVNVNGTLNVIQACKEIPDIRLIHISSSNAVKEFSETGVFDENQEYVTSEEFGYPITKAKAEIEVLKAVTEFNLDAFIIRPTAIAGAPDQKPSLMGQTILDFINEKFPVLTTGGYDIVDLRDVSDTIINSIELGKKGEIYLLGGHYVSVKELAQLANPKYKPYLLSINTLLFLMPLINMGQKILNTKLPLTKESLTTLKNAPNNVDSSKAKKALNHKPRPIHETINDLKHWFNSN